MDTIRPNIESYLQQELELEELHLGEISWHWAGFLWLKVDRLDFSSSQHGLAFHDGSASVRIPLDALFNGEVAPDKIILRYGILDLELTDSTAAPLFPHQLVLDKTQINWRMLPEQNTPEWHGELSNVHLEFNAAKRTINASSPDITLSAQWDADGLPHKLELDCKHTDWLPASIRQHISGSPQASITLIRNEPRSWAINSSISSQQPIALKLSQISQSYAFNTLAAELQISLNKTAASDLGQNSLEQVIIRDLKWSLAESNITAQGKWQDGALHLSAESKQLPMPLVWSWIQPLGDDEWRQWLSLMQQGVAKQAGAEISLSWPNPLRNQPTMEAWESMQYRVQAQLEDADIALGISDSALTNTRGSVDLNQDGLNAQIEDTILPKGLGHASASIHMPSDTLFLHINGTSNSAINNLLEWLGPSEINDWKWNKARANAHFEFIWDPEEEDPKEARITLQPDGIWNIEAFKFPLQLSQGEVQWDQSRGLSLKAIHFSASHMQGTVSLDAAQENNEWKIKTLEANGTSQLAPLAAHFQLPMSHTDGSIISRLHYDGQWSGELDMKSASWEHLLGSNKKAGEPFSLQYQAQLNTAGKLPTVQIDKLISTGKHIKLEPSSASINQSGLKAQLSGLHTPSFRGKLDIDVPFDDRTMWKVDAKASYLNRNALPDTLDHSEKLVDKAWLLRADIDQFDWDDARMSGVHIKLSSDKNSLGIMEAAQVHTTQLDIMDVDARFTLPGLGRVELRKFSAVFEKQELTMSATLTPEMDGGMRWKGFAELHGDFGHLMNRGGLSKRFLDGDGHLLFSGQGLILKEQPWWQGLDGRLRLRVDQGRILEGGTLTTLLSAINLSELPALLFGQRKDLSGPGIMYKRLQMEAIMQDQSILIRNVAMRSSAFDLVGQGNMDLDKNLIDLYLIAKPLQNLDALLAKIPLLRDILGGRSHSLMRKVYHLNGSFSDAKVEAIQPKDAGLSESGFVERLFSLPDNWFGAGQKGK